MRVRVVPESTELSPGAAIYHQGSTTLPIDVRSVAIYFCTRILETKHQGHRAPQRRAHGAIHVDLEIQCMVSFDAQ